MMSWPHGESLPMRVRNGVQLDGLLDRGIGVCSQQGGQRIALLANIDYAPAPQAELRGGKRLRYMNPKITAASVGFQSERPIFCISWNSI